ncbi:MAG: alginate lyase family protein [Desulfotignum sp.]|nr:alginate lyase family protein [Desulfotignum sp.]
MSGKSGLGARHVIHYARLMGWRWIFFRITHACKKKTGCFSLKNKRLLSKERRLNWEHLVNRIDIGQLNITDQSFKGDHAFIEKADHALSGNIFSFSSHYLNYWENGQIAWNINPENRRKAPLDVPWNKISDFGNFGDIKLIWEASRFPQVFYFINAYSLTKENKYAHGCIRQIVDWCRKNPFPNGPHYKCGQEITFRLFSWMIALDYFHNFVSNESKVIILQNIYISILRIDINIDYAAKSVRNNHSISESAGLIVGAVLFPEFPESPRLLKKGLSYLKKELGYQVYDDGAYIQHSMTYQRLVVDIVSFVIFICRKKKISLPIEITRAHHKMMVFLLSFMQKNGWLPNYGNNDGTNLFPASDADYRDFRPSLNFGTAVSPKKTQPGKPGDGGICNLFGLTNKGLWPDCYENAFRDGGYYILRNSKCFGFMRAHAYKDRPGQCDMLHLDIWYNGHNIFCDSGSFSYYSKSRKVDGFQGTAGHNTIVINDADQMNKAGRFGWAPWVTARVLNFSHQQIVAEHYGYQKTYGAVHRRSVRMTRYGFIVNDRIMGAFDEIKIQQIWNMQDQAVQMDAWSMRVQNNLIHSNIKGRVEKTHISHSYNQYSKGQKIIFETIQNKACEIETIIAFDHFNQ